MLNVNTYINIIQIKAKASFSRSDILLLHNILFAKACTRRLPFKLTHCTFMLYGGSLKNLKRFLKYSLTLGSHLMCIEMLP